MKKKKKQMIDFDVFLFWKRRMTCMRITELLQDATIDLGVKVNSKEEAIDHLVDLMVRAETSQIAKNTRRAF